MSKPRRRPRDDGFKKIDRIIVTSALQGDMELPLLFNVHKSMFLVEIDGEDVFEKDVKMLRAAVEALIKRRESLTWERWIAIDYSARYKLPGVRDYTIDLNEEPPDPDDEPEDRTADVLLEMSFSFDVFDLSSPIKLSDEAKRVHRAQRWGEVPDEERLRRAVRRDGDAWVADEYHDRVAVDILQERNKIFRAYTDDFYASLVAIQEGLKNLDARLRLVLESPHLPQLIRGNYLMLQPGGVGEPQGTEAAPARAKKRGARG